MKLKDYMSRPVHVEAVKLNERNCEAVRGWMRRQGKSSSKVPGGITVETSDGEETATWGNYIFRAPGDEFFTPMRAGEFQETFDLSAS